MTTQSNSDVAQALSNQFVTSMAEIDRIAQEQKSKVYKALDSRGAIGFLDMFGHDMGREALDQAYRAIDDLAAKQRGEVIDMARSDLESLRAHQESAHPNPTVKE